MKRREGRRAEIARALHQCMLAKGYASTSLADVARAADMTPSHLLYYFKNKDAVLAYSLERTAERILEHVRDRANLSPGDQLDELADYFFDESGLGKAAVGVMLEVFGAAVHHKEMNRRKAAFDRAFKLHLVALFERVEPAFDLSPGDAAEEAYALMIGLRTSAYFDERLGLERARESARRGLRRLAGLGSERGAD